MHVKLNKLNRWLFALIQHPMILAVHEDRGVPVIGERTSPWGAADIHEYAGRVRRNLEALRIYPDLRLNYEFSGVELQILLDNAPDLAPVIREMVEQGKLAFVGGDYSQPHGQLFSGELNYRQLEHGLQTFRELAGYQVKTFFHQETCLHDQLPQILNAFGFTTAAPPLMSHVITPVSGTKFPSLVATEYSARLMPVNQDSVAQWLGLDGSEIPVVIPGISDPGLNLGRVRQESQAGLYRCAEIVIAAPDMQEISPADYEGLTDLGESILLDQALSSKVAQCPPTWKARLHSCWSYSEGEWAEAMYRQIRRAEVMILAEEAFAAVNGLNKRRDYDADLKTILSAMHHDVHWMEVTDLKKTYLARLEQVINRSTHEIASQVASSGIPVTSGRRIRVLNALPYERQEIVRLSVPGCSRVQVMAGDGASVPSQSVPAWNKCGETDVFFLAQVAPLGTSDYAIVSTGEDLPLPEEDCRWAAVQAGAAFFKIRANGTVSEAMIDGNNALHGPGHDLHYLADDGSSIGGPDRPGSMQNYQGELGHILRITAPIGDIPVEIEYVASPYNKALEFSTRFLFTDHTIGVMWEDWTKLNAYWPVIGDKIRHDIPYGTISGAEPLPLYAPSWISVRSEMAGLAVLNTGTPKHFVSDGVLGCVYAWGGRTFTNRQDVEGHMNFLEVHNHEYDCTLKGEQIIHAGAMALAPDTSETEIARAAQCLNSPLLIFGAEAELSGAVSRPGSSPGALDLSKTGLIITAVFSEGGRLVYRFYEGAGSTHAVADLCKALGCELLVTDLAGNRLAEVTPYRIGCLIV